MSRTISFLCLRQFSKNWYEVLALVELMSSCNREEVYRIRRQVARGDRREPMDPIPSYHITSHDASSG